MPDTVPGPGQPSGRAQHHHPNHDPPALTHHQEVFLRVRLSQIHALTVANLEHDIHCYRERATVSLNTLIRQNLAERTVQPGRWTRSRAAPYSYLAVRHRARGLAAIENHALEMRALWDARWITDAPRLREDILATFHAVLPLPAPSQSVPDQGSEETRGQPLVAESPVRLTEAQLRRQRAEISSHMARNRPATSQEQLEVPRYPSWDSWQHVIAYEQRVGLGNIRGNTYEEQNARVNYLRLSQSYLYGIAAFDRAEWGTPPHPRQPPFAALNEVMAYLSGTTQPSTLATLSALPSQLSPAQLRQLSDRYDRSRRYTAVTPASWPLIRPRARYSQHQQALFPERLREETVEAHHLIEGLRWIGSDPDAYARRPLTILRTLGTTFTRLCELGLRLMFEEVASLGPTPDEPDVWGLLTGERVESWLTARDILNSLYPANDLGFRRNPHSMTRFPAPARIPVDDNQVDSSSFWDPVTPGVDQEVLETKRRIIDDLPRAKVDEEGFVDVFTCQELEIGAEVVQLPCSHRFETTGIKTWLEKNKSCPTCRHTVNPRLA